MTNRESLNNTDLNLTPETTPAQPVSPTQETVVAPTPVAEAPAQQPQKVKKTFAGGTWTALIAGALLLIVLLIFIMQNQQPVELTFMQWGFTFPAGVGFLLAAIAGALIMALVGGVRMLQLRRQIKKGK